MCAATIYPPSYNTAERLNSATALQTVTKVMGMLYPMPGSAYITPLRLQQRTAKQQCNLAHNHKHLHQHVGYPRAALTDTITNQTIPTHAYSAPVCTGITCTTEHTPLKPAECAETVGQHPTEGAQILGLHRN
jgi:hypothetical protein